ncbi:sulfite exporter TauE/SafE family protein [Vibrio sp. TH_r3]|uniref:sulfite exporter TauE/SafE family protein n=1 Tax=Vibrio sp. TH_r3 TaxID=3082084 RepID=UPI0029532807|nr:sulfite exporter TauE/SafE family protein [Vibrio sp. TH_r3]MDV7102821.1 sulfite exporter TauE/SafE family protein [Vibrio sp. TH_r3]
MLDGYSPVLLAMAIIFLGSFVQTAIGFGLAILAAPLLMLLSNDYVPVPIVIIALFITSLSTLKNRSNIEVGELKSAIIGRVPGSVVGGLLLTYVSVQVLSLWLGIIVLLSLLVSLLPFRIEPTRNKMAIAGFLSGFMGTSSGIGGPPMAILLQHQEANKFRGNLSAFFLFSSIMSLVVQWLVGYLTVEHIYMSLPLLPAAWLGYKVATLVAHRLSKQWIRWSALSLCLISGVGAIVKSFS